MLNTAKYPCKTGEQEIGYLLRLRLLLQPGFYSFSLGDKPAIQTRLLELTKLHIFIVNREKSQAY